MYSEYMLIVFLLVKYSLQTGAENVTDDRDNNRIYKGGKAIHYNAPYQVLLKILLPHNVTSICGGSIITLKFVLTSAHCVDHGVEVDIIFGASSFAYETLMVLTSKKFKIHEKFDSKIFNSPDIAVIELPKAMHLNKEVQLIKLPRKLDANRSYIGQRAILTGYGNTNAGDTTVNKVFKWLKVSIVSASNCGHFELSPDLLCGHGQFNGAACFGDGGNPLVIRNDDYTITQIGIISFGPANCKTGSANMYTKISSYIDWIEEHSDYKPNY